MTSELKPCFSCMGEAKLIKRSFYASKESRLKSYRERVECKVCGLTTREYKKPNAAVHSWNTRATPSADTLAGLVRYTKEYIYDEGSSAMRRSANGEYVLYSEAAAVVAAKDAEKTERINHWSELYSQQYQRSEAAEAELVRLKAQEPVAWRGKHRNNSDQYWNYNLHPDSGFDPEKYEQQPLYAAPVSDSLKAENERLRKLIMDCLKELDRSARPSYAWQLKARAALNVEASDDKG